MDFAGHFQARPERIGRVKESRRIRGAFCILVYRSLSTVNGEPAVGRYAGRGGGIGDLMLGGERLEVGEGP